MMPRTFSIVLLAFLLLPFPAAAQKSQQIFDLFLQGAQQEMQRQQQRDYERQQRQHLQQLHQHFVGQWHACHGGDLAACNGALSYPYASANDRQALISRKAQIFAAQQEAAERAHRQRIEAEYEARRQREQLEAAEREGDMVRTLSRLARFDPALDDRLIILDPADTAWPLRLNMFDINRARIDALSLGAREQILAGIVELYDYIFGSLLGAELTQKQSVVFRYIARLMLEIPDANIQTLRQLMEEKQFSTFAPYIAKLRGTTRAFFENEFSDRSFSPTKQQIRRRLYGVLSNPAFERMFSHPKNAFDMKAAFDSGKVVLINTAKDVLKAEASAIFGRYMIALAMQAALERAADPETSRRPAFVYIDEAADYFDQNIDTLLIHPRRRRWRCAAPLYAGEAGARQA